MIITCQLYSSKTSALNVSMSFRAEDFHHAKTSMECVEMSISIGNAGTTTLFYVSHDEYQRILPLLTGDVQAPVLPADVVEAYREWKSRDDVYATPCTTNQIIEAIEAHLPKDQS